MPSLGKAEAAPEETWMPSRSSVIEEGSHTGTATMSWSEKPVPVMDDPAGMYQMLWPEAYPWRKPPTAAPPKPEAPPGPPLSTASSALLKMVTFPAWSSSSLVMASWSTIHEARSGVDHPASNRAATKAQVRSAAMNSQRGPKTTLAMASTDEPRPTNISQKRRRSLNRE